MEKHIKSGSLHQWAKEKFCRPEQSNEIDRNQSTVRKQSTLERCVAGSVRKNYTQLFNTALSLVLGEKPLSDFPFAITLQKRNGVKFAPGKDDEHSCAIKTREEKELVFCKVVIRGQPVELLLRCQKMADIGGVDAACTKKAFDNAFTTHYDVSPERYNDHLVAVCADGASVNMGTISDKYRHKW